MADGKKKQDIGWKYGTDHPEKKGCVICNFCGRDVTAGIYRHKLHLAGNSTLVTACLSCPDHVRQEMIQHLNEKATAKELLENAKVNAKVDAKVASIFYDVDEEEDEDEEETMPSKCKKRTFSLSQASSKGSTAKSKFKGPMDLYVKKNRGKGVNLRQTSIRDACDKEARNRTNQKIARFFYQAGIAFNAAKLDSFKEMIEAIGEYGPNLKPPSYHELRVTLLKQELEYTENLLKENREETENYGCPIMSDGWSDRKGRTPINMLENNAKGTVFLESIDASALVKDGNLLFKLLDKFVERVGPKNVVQVITDNGANYVRAGKLLQQKRPHIFWTPCAAHCIDLMLEDIGKLPRVHTTIARGIALVGFIYNHAGVLAMMRQFTGGKELVRYGVTRFATTFLSLQSIHRKRRDLTRMFLSEEWSNSRWAKEANGKRMKAIICMPSIWNSVTYTLKIMCPLVMVLRIAHSEKMPAMGYIYEAMDRAKESLLSSFGNDQEKCQDVLDIIDERWNN